MLWATGELEDAAAAWLALRGRLEGTGLVPVLLSGLEHQPERPWDAGELEPCDPGTVGELDAAVLVHLGFDTMNLLAERPVPSNEAALAVAAEHFAFCSDNVCQGVGSIRRYAAGLPGATIWSFWWD